MAEEEDYKTDTDLGSGPDSSVSLEESPFAELQVAIGEYYAEVLSQVKRRKDDLELDAMAGITFGGEVREALRDLRKMMRRFDKDLVFYKFPANSVKTSSEQLFLEVKEVNAPRCKMDLAIYVFHGKSPTRVAYHLKSHKVTYSPQVTSKQGHKEEAGT